MDTELTDYIFNYCYEFFTEKERKAREHYTAQVKFGDRNNLPEPFEKLRERMRTHDTEVLSLLENGYSHFIRTTAERDLQGTQVRTPT